MLDYTTIQYITTNFSMTIHYYLFPNYITIWNRVE